MSVICRSKHIITMTKSEPFSGVDVYPFVPLSLDNNICPLLARRTIPSLWNVFFCLLVVLLNRRCVVVFTSHICQHTQNHLWRLLIWFSMPCAVACEVIWHVKWFLTFGIWISNSFNLDSSWVHGKASTIRVAFFFHHFAGNREMMISIISVKKTSQLFTY